MGKVFEGIGALIVGLNYLFSCFLVLINYGFFWALVSFFIAPIGAIAAPFVVNTWGFFLVGVFFYIIGTVLTGASKKRLFKQFLEYEMSAEKQLANRIQKAELVGKAEALKIFLNEPIAGPGKLIASPTGQLFWSGDSGESFNIEDNVESWGRSEFGKNEKKFYFRTTTLKEFAINENEAPMWREWFARHYPTKERR